MLNRIKTYFGALAMLLVVAFSLQGCKTTQEGNVVTDNGTQVTQTVVYKFERSTIEFEKQGKHWGEKQSRDQRKPTDISDISNVKHAPAIDVSQCAQRYIGIDETFVQALIDKSDIDYFPSNTDWKEAFIKGYKQGFKDRTADLVLGPHLTVAAACIGNATGLKLTNVINSFSRDWEDTLTGVINTFITLVQEGSQSDREAFIAAFRTNYTAKYNEETEKSSSSIRTRSDGGTVLYLDPKTLGVLNLSSPDSLSAEVYHKIFQVMGDEWGRRYKAGTIKREELIALLRASKTAFMEVVPGLQGNLATVQRYFVEKYGTDGDNVFKSLSKDAGLL